MKIHDEQLSLGDKLADRIAQFGGSWAAIIVSVTIIVVWIIVNSIWSTPVDPFPYILLNLVLSCVAALQAPFILMAANRQQAKDRASLEEDLLIDQRSEQTIKEIAEKLNVLISKIENLE